MPDIWLSWPTMETTVLAAKNQLSLLLRKAEAGEEVFIRRGAKGPLFQITTVVRPQSRTLTPDPRWKNKIRYEDEAIWESGWKESE